MTWQGTMKCQLQNALGLEIDSLNFSHNWTNGSGPDSPPNNGSITLKAGELLEFDINVGSGGDDDWSFSFAVGGGSYSRNGKQCDIEYDDYSSGDPVSVIFMPAETGWSINMPSSSSCTDNSYSVV